MRLRSATDRLRSAAARLAKNPHFWVVLVLCGLVLFFYQAWPWRDWQLEKGVWRFFPWLAQLEPLVVKVELKYHLFGALFLAPIVYGSLTLSWPGGTLAWALSLIWVLPTLLSWRNSAVLLNLAFLLLPVLLVAIVNGERRWRESEKRHFAEREEERKAYIAKLVETQEAERRRIAQELHDETLQTLMVIANKADSLATASGDGHLAEGNRWIKQELLKTMEDLRRLSMNLRPSILDNFGLVSGIRWLVNHSNAQGDCRLEVTVVGVERKMSSLAEVTAFRVIQEAIANIQRHAHAMHGKVTLEFADDRLRLEVWDDGVGFQPPERLGTLVSQSKLGMLGMEQRILSLGGTIEIEAYPGRGTRIRAEIPYQPLSEIIQLDKA